MDIYKSYELKLYNLLFILERTLIKEQENQETIDLLIESGYLPLTIIIIGEGKNDFEKMFEEFKKKSKISSLGMEKNRNNFIFIRFLDDFNQDPVKMIEYCLKEIKKQILEFYQLIKCTPQLIKNNYVENIKESFNLYKSLKLNASQIKMQKSQKQEEDTGFSIFDNNNSNEDIDEEIRKSFNPSPEIKHKQNKNEIKEEKEEPTPNGEYILPSTSVYDPNGLIDNKSNQYMKGNPKIFANTSNECTPGQNNNMYLLPENTIIQNKKLMNNPYKNETPQGPNKYTLPNASIIDNDNNKNIINYNPYKKEATLGPSNFILPSTSILSPCTNLNQINPYNKTGQNQENNSRALEFISTNNSNNSNNNSENYSSSNSYSKKNNNYSIDTSNIK